MRIPAFWSETWTVALVNHLWQSTVVVAIAWLGSIALRKNHARARYWVWFAASVKFLLPFSLLIEVGEGLRSLFPVPVVARPALTTAIEQITQPFLQAQVSDATGSPTPPHRAELLPWLLFAIWAFGFLIVVIRWVREWWRMRVAIRSARPLRVAARVSVLSIQSSIEPGIFGIFRPVLLLPDGILGRLTQAQLEAILAHEMCHVRRRDNLTFAIHMAVEALFWFHPLVWWIGARLIDERERACDEAVVQAGSAAHVYAEGILNVCKFCVESPLECVAGVTGADLKKRIRRIMTEHAARNLTLSRKLLLGVTALTGMTMPVMFGLIRAAQLRVQAQQAEVVSALPRFEVASVKPSKPDARENNWRGSATGVSIENYTLRRLIRVAYGLKMDSQVVGGPRWLDQKAFDIAAKFDDAEAAKVRNMSGQARFAEIGLMVRALLAERFQLKVSQEVQHGPILALVQAKSGAKLTPSPPKVDESGRPLVKGDFGIHSHNGHMTATNLSMDSFADFLAAGPETGGRMVVNRTGLTGQYDLKLDWTEDHGSGVAPDSEYPGLLTALQEQLGLKLEPQKGPVETLVVDHVEQPSPN